MLPWYLSYCDLSHWPTFLVLSGGAVSLGHPIGCSGALSKTKGICVCSAILKQLQSISVSFHCFYCLLGQFQCGCQGAYLVMSSDPCFSICFLCVSVHVARTTILWFALFLGHQLKAYCFGLQVSSKSQKLLLFCSLPHCWVSIQKLGATVIHIKFRCYSLNNCQFRSGI